MTNAHKFLKSWIQENYDLNLVKVYYSGCDLATIINSSGEELKITLNLFCDIVNYETGAILS